MGIMGAVELEVPRDTLWGVDRGEAIIGRPLQGARQHRIVGGGAGLLW